MSGLAGVYHLDGRAADRAVLRRMLAAARHRGPDRVGEWCCGPIALGHALLHSTPESVGEHQPLANERGSVSLAFDGRIDNRDDLRARLTSSGIHVRTDTDAELVLRAYEHVGAEACALLLGDFALAIWDGDARRLLCARDPLGIRPLCYATTTGAFLWASEVKQLFASGLVEPAPNPGFIGELLSYQPTSLEDTLYDSVLRLPPGHAVTIENGRRTLTRFFAIDTRRDIRYARDAEYAEHFYELFKRSVEARLRAVGPASVFLSGGVDSTAIAGMTQALRKAPGGPAAAFLSLAASRPEADERRFVDEASRFWNVPVTTISADGYPPPAMDDSVACELDFPDAPNTAPWGLLLDRVRASGGRVVLWGHGGDEWLTGDASHCADLLARFEVAGALRQLRADIDASNQWGGGGVGVRDAVRWTLLPLLPRLVKRLARPLLGRRVPPWVNRDLAKRVDLEERLRRTDRLGAGFETAAQRAISAQLDDGWLVLERELVDRFNARFSVEPRFPFHDLRVIEFALAVPESQRWRGAQTKYVLRQALRALMPESVRLRRTKADYSYFFSEMLERECAGDTFRRLRLAADGYVDARQAEQAYARCRAGSRRDLDTVWIILTLERWYRTMFSGGLRDRSRQPAEPDRTGTTGPRHPPREEAVRGAGPRRVRPYREAHARR